MMECPQVVHIMTLEIYNTKNIKNIHLNGLYLVS